MCADLTRFKRPRRKNPGLHCALCIHIYIEVGARGRNFIITIKRGSRASGVLRLWIFKLPGKQRVNSRPPSAAADVISDTRSRIPSFAFLIDNLIFATWEYRRLITPAGERKVFVAALLINQGSFAVLSI